MTNLDSIKQLRDTQFTVVKDLQSRGYARRGVPQYQKAIYARAVRVLDSLNIQIEKIEYNQSAVIKLLKRSGLSASNKFATGVRGYYTYSKGYEIDNKYAVSYISLHHVSEAEVESLKNLFTNQSINASIDSNGISLRKAL
jgi:hypothetical protein